MDLMTGLTIFVVCVTLYAFLSDTVRSVLSRSGIALPSFPTMLLYAAWQGFVWLAYRVIVGREPGVNRSQVAPVAYVTRIQQDTPPIESADPISDPSMETEIDEVPALSDAGKSDGNSGFHFRSLQEANDYAETLLLDRLSDLVMAEKLDKGAAIKYGMRAPTGRAYQAAKDKLEKAILAKSLPVLTASRQTSKAS